MPLPKFGDSDFGLPWHKAWNRGLPQRISVRGMRRGPELVWDGKTWDNGQPKVRTVSGMMVDPKRQLQFLEKVANRINGCDLRLSLFIQEERKILKLLDSNAASERVSEDVPLIGTTSENSSVRKIYKYPGLAELPASFLRFGPVYYDANDALGMVKEEAWKHLLDKSPRTEDVCLDAFRRVGEEVKACYADATLGGLNESQFQWMMIKDGCFFLQLVLFILGASKELGYPNDHITFGTKQGGQGRKEVHGWIKSMFHVGNQIPLLVLNEFMKQDFFQDVVKKHGKWERPTDLLSKKVLYDLLVLPVILYGNNNCEGYLSDEQPSDILHGLQNLVLGSKISRNNVDIEEDDTDEEDEESRDLEVGATSNSDHGNDSEELCVSGLRRKGIYFWKSNNGAGIRGIRFKNRMLFPGLYLPTIQLNQETELLFRNLKYYEMCQQEGLDEVRSFLGLMNKLISTQEDIKHLSSKEILEISKPQYGEKFMRMLQNLSETVTDRNHRHVLQQLRDYSFSFRCLKFKKVAMILLILTIAQTVFVILSYFVSVREGKPK